MVAGIGLGPQARTRITIAGGYGVFGQTLAREVLASLPVTVVVAGRDPRRAAQVCQSLKSAGHTESLALDLRDRHAVAAAAAGSFALVCTAGPFQSLDPELPRAVAEAGCHWLDISDVSGWVLSVLANQALHRAAVGHQVAVMPGLSTVPALSGVLVRWAFSRVTGPRRARIVLFIGNRNAKGAAAIASAAMSGFDEPVLMDLPSGRRPAYRMDSPDAVLLRQDPGIDAEFRVTLEWRLANLVMALVRRRPGAAGFAPGMRVARWLSALSTPLSMFGSDRGSLSAEVVGESGCCLRASLTGSGQRLAVLPCVLALEALLRGELRQRGCVNPVTWLRPQEWLDRLGALQIRFEVHDGSAG
jgi:hypothetical protein